MSDDVPCLVVEFDTAEVEARERFGERRASFDHAGLRVQEHDGLPADPAQAARTRVQTAEHVRTDLNPELLGDSRQILQQSVGIHLVQCTSSNQPVGGELPTLEKRPEAGSAKARRS